MRIQATTTTSFQAGRHALDQDQACPSRNAVPDSEQQLMVSSTVREARKIPSYSWAVPVPTLDIMEHLIASFRLATPGIGIACCGEPAETLLYYGAAIIADTSAVAHISALSAGCVQYFNSSRQRTSHRAGTVDPRFRNLLQQGLLPE